MSASGPELADLVKEIASRGIMLPVEIGCPFKPQTQYSVDPEDEHFPHSNFEVCRHAVDYGVPDGTPVLAVLPGRVLMVKDDSQEFGYTMDYADKANMVCLDHGRIYSEYIHLGYKQVFVRLGDWVEAGTVLGLTGSSGLTSGPHLHLNVFGLVGTRGVSVPFVIKAGG